MDNWYEDENFWDTLRPYLFGPERIGAAADEISKALTLLNLPASANVLDLCCGVGRHSIELARLGYRVTGVDRTTNYLKRAAEVARDQHLDIEFVESDMREFVRPGSFDGAINLFTSFGYFAEPTDNARVLANLCLSLKPGAKLIIDVIGKEVLGRIFAERLWHEAADGSIVLEKHKLRSGWDWIENRWTLIRGAQRKELTFAHWLYSGTELSAMLTAAGFSTVTLYGSLAGSAYDHKAARLVAVATK